MDIPVFASVGSRLTIHQSKLRDNIYGLLEDVGLSPRTVGVSDYAAESPLREVVVLAKHCAGAIILGFAEYEIRDADRVTAAAGLDDRDKVTGARMATSWNQIEAGICEALGLPMVIFREDGVMGGVFEVGSTNQFLQRIPTLEQWDAQSKQIREVMYQWRSRVHAQYYRI